MGQPNIFDRILRYTEYIGVSRNTQGTETSHYLQEEKENSIPLVAASETGKAQTKELALWGCRTFNTELQKNEIVEAAWKGPP